MTSDQWRKVADLFHAACERSPDQRSAFLAEACGDGDVVRREVESLLRQDVSQDGPLERVAQDAKTWIATSAHPQFIGRYRILGVIGEGGMGAVYRAEQEHPRRTVALKVIRPGVTAPEAL